MNLQGKNIYIVEDTTENVFILLALLKEYKANVQVDWWARGEAKRVLEALPLDLIILDLGLQDGRSGYDVFEELRTLPELDDVPIIAVSAADPTTAIARTRKLGFSGFIGKPIDFDLFPQQIEAILRGLSVWYAD